MPAQQDIGISATIPLSMDSCVQYLYPSPDSRRLLPFLVCVAVSFAVSKATVRLEHRGASLVQPRLPEGRVAFAAIFHHLLVGLVRLHGLGSDVRITVLAGYCSAKSKPFRHLPGLVEVCQLHIQVLLTSSKNLLGKNLRLAMFNDFVCAQRQFQASTFSHPSCTKTSATCSSLK